MTDDITAEDAREQILNRVDSYFVARERAFEYVCNHPVVAALQDFSRRCGQKVYVKVDVDSPEIGEVAGLKVSPGGVKLRVKSIHGHSTVETGAADDDTLSTAVRFVQSQTFQREAVAEVEEMTEDAINAASYIPADDD